MLIKTLRAFSDFTEIIIASDDPERVKALALEYCTESGLLGRIRICRGGACRQDSIANALSLVTGDIVLIHDAARPFVSPAVIEGVLSALEGADAAVPCVRPKSTIRTREETLDRDALYEVQTPQGFKSSVIKAAYEHAKKTGFSGTDDIGVFENFSADPPLITEGDYGNIKITTKEDLPMELRTGNGYDVHRLVEGRPLMLGCTKIPFEKGLFGHSDADVAAHAIADSLLGAAALGDIGHIFPDDSRETEGMAGAEILARTAEMIRQKGYTIMMVDCTIIAEKPKLAPYIKVMRENSARALGIAAEQLSIKATTEEGLGERSRDGIAALATAMLKG